MFQEKLNKRSSYTAYDASELKCSINSAREHSWHKLANHVLTIIGLPHRSQYAIFAGTVFSSIILSLISVHMKYTRFKASVINFFFCYLCKLLELNIRACLWLLVSKMLRHLIIQYFLLIQLYIIFILLLNEARNTFCEYRGITKSLQKASRMFSNLGNLTSKRVLFPSCWVF